MKRSLCFLLSLVMVLCTISGTLFVSASASAVGTAGLTYELNDDGESYTVTGSSNTISGELVIPDTYNGKPVTAVGIGAFDDCGTISSVVFGDNVEVIEPYAFNRSSVTSVVLPDGLKEIQEGALYCPLETVDIPDSVEYIGASGVIAQDYVENNGYYYVDNWLIEAAVDGGPQKVAVLDGTVGIADNVIEYMDEFTGAKYVTIPASVKYIAPSSFNGYAGVYLAEDNPYFEEVDGVIYTQDMKRLLFASPDFVYGDFVIPDGVEVIDVFAFVECNNLNSVRIPDSVTAFSNGLDYILKIMGDEADMYSSPDLCLAFMLSLDLESYFKIYTGCSSAAANMNYVMSFAAEDGWVYNTKVALHNEVTIPGREPTCTANGLTEGIKCADCKVVIKKQESIPGGHSYGEMTVYTAPTTTSSGVGRVTCENCGSYETVILAQLPVAPKTNGSNDVGGVKVYWNSVTGATGYQLYRREAGSSTWVKIATTTGTQYFDKNVTNNKYYIYCAKAYNVDGAVSAYNSANTKTVKVTSTPVLTSIQNATGGVQIKWNAVAGTTTYRVYRRGAGSTYWTYLGDTKSTSYVDSKASSGAYWRYTVRAVNSGYYSGFDTTGLYIKRLANPYSIKAANAVGGVAVSWGKVNGAASYRVYRKAAGQSSWTYLAETTAAAYTDKNVKSGTYYKYTVRAVSGSTYSSFYDGSLVRYLQTPVVSSHTNTTKNVTIKWNSVTGATGYRVYRRGAGEGWKYITTVSGTSYTDSKVTKNAYYRYTVRAVNGSYMSGYDNNGYVLKFTPASTTSSSSSSSLSADDIMSNPLAAYQKAANAIHTNGVAGYELRQWQSIDSFNMSGASYLSDTMETILESFMTKEEEAEIKVNSKGSADAKNRMPASQCSKSCVQSATAVKSGSNYVITIVMKDQVNPSYTDKDGIGVMSRSFLDYKDVEDTVKNNSTVSKVVKGIDGQINYKGYKIVATMNSKGQFVRIQHYGVGNINANLTLVAGGSTCTGSISFYADYRDFVY